MIKHSFISIPGKSDCQLGPSLLILCATVYFICVAASDCWLDIGILAVLLLVAGALARLKVRQLFDVIKSAWLIIAIAAMFHLIFRMWFVGELDRTILSSVIHTSFFLCRLILLMFMTSYLFKLYSPAAYAESIASRMRIVVGGKFAGSAGHVSMLALSMLPQLREHMGQRKLARELRQLPPSQSIGSRYDQVRMEMGSAFHYVLEYANVLATVLWSRGFRTDRPVQLSMRRETSVSGFWLAVTFCLLSLCTLLTQRTV